MVLDNIPGVGTLEKVAQLVEQTAQDVGKVIDAALKHDPIGHLVAFYEHSVPAGALITKLLSFTYHDLISLPPTEIYKEMLTEGLGLDYGKIESEAQSAIKTVDSMLTFAFALPIVFGAFGAVLKALGAQRISEVWDNVLGKIPEEIGVTWALGQQIDRAFETAVGTAIEEAINVQKHPTRLEWPVLRQLFRQKVLSEKDADTYLDKLGYPDDLKALIKQLDTAQLSVGDLANLWRWDLLGRGGVKDYLTHLGYTDDDAEKLTTLYIDKADLASLAQIRSTANQLVRAQLITDGQYESLLQSANEPDRDIQDALIAIDLEKKYGRIAAVISAIRTEWLHGDLTDDQATTRLAQLGYSGQAIADLFTAWKEPRVPHPMSASKVLSYWYSGVITDRLDAYNRLVATNLRGADANFLLDHPPAGGARVHRVTPALITQAYLDGVIPETGLEAAYKNAGLADDAVPLQTSVAKYRASHRKPPKGPGTPLNTAQIRDAYKYSLFSADQAIARLEAEGYSSDDALILLEITAKGAFNPNAAPVASLFGTLAGAIDFLESLGFTINNPPDPRIAAAEGVVEQAGYTVIPPAGGIPAQPVSAGPPGSPPPIIQP